MTISSLNFKLLTLALLYRFMSRLIELIDDIGAAQLGIEKPVEKLLRPAFVKLDESYKKSRGSQFTGKISDKEKLLDNATVSFFQVVNTGQKSSNPEKAAAAKNLSFHIKQYKGVAWKQRKEQVADTENMIQDIEEKCSADVEILDLGELLSEIKVLNKEIGNYELSRTKETTDKRDKNAEEAKKGIIEAYRVVCKSAEVNVLLDGNAELKEFIGNLNTIISEFGGAGGSGNVGDIAPDVPQDYPDAKEWIEDLPFMGVENGDIYYILVAGKKVFYKLVDKQKFFWHPESEKGAGGWEKLN